MTDSLRERDQAEVDPRELRLLVLLGTARTSRTWLAAGPGGEMRVARRLVPGPEGPAVVMARMEAARGVEHPSLIPPGEVWTAGTALWMSRRHRDGVSLRRLIAVTRLAPAHLLRIADDTLAGLVALHAAGVAHGSLHPGNILIAADGTAAAVDMGYSGGDADGRSGGEPRGLQEAGSAEEYPGGDLAALAAGMRSALSPPGRRAARAGIVGDMPPALAALLEAGRPFAGAASAVEALAAVRAAAGEPTPAARRQIGALVVPLQHERIGISGAGGPPRAASPGGAASAAPPRPTPAGAGAAASPPSAARLAAPSGPTLRRPPRASRSGSGPPPRGRARVAPLARTATLAARLAEAWRRRIPAAPAGGLPRLSGRSRLILWGVPVLAAVVTAGVALAVTPDHTPPPLPATSSSAAPLAGGVAATRPPASSPATPTPSAATRSAPNAPPTAGDVAGLSVTLASPVDCTAAPGQSCLLRVTVNLAPHPSETVAWDLMVVDTCTGLSATDPGTSVPAAAGYAYVWGETSVTFVSADPVRLYAVTIAPARAASQALPLAGGGGGC